jgi:hypothetical protein
MALKHRSLIRSIGGGIDSHRNSYDNANEKNLTNFTLVNPNNNDVLEKTSIDLSYDTETFTFVASQ